MSVEHYWNWTELAQVYLEDSFVLKICEANNTLELDMEFVLREGHPAYETPREKEQYCYRRGKLVFAGARDVRWLEKRNVISWDERGEHDMGNIDVLCLDNGWFTLQGDWGRVQLHAEGVHLELAQ